MSTKGMTILRGAPVPRRFLQYVTVGDECWEWSGTISQSGYGYFWNGQRTVRAHRYAYEWLSGPIPEGLTIDHLCRNTRCVNPAHLEAVSAKVNILRGNGLCARNARKTHCPQGHPYNEENTYHERGSRNCRKCKVARDHRRYERIKRLAA